MARGVLVETGFLLALNPQDRHHEWALQLLNQAKKGRTRLFLSSPAILELTLILRSRGVGEEGIEAVLESMDIIIRSHTRLNYVYATLESVALASRLRRKYSDLTFFDSLHAALSIVNGLEYGDLDPIIQRVVSGELR